MWGGWVVGELGGAVDVVVDSPSTTTSTAPVSKTSSNKFARYNAKRKEQKVEDQRARRLKQKESKPIKKRKEQKVEDQPIKKRKEQKVEDQRARRLKQKESKPIKKRERETRTAINKRHNAKRRQPAVQDLAGEVSVLCCGKCKKFAKVWCGVCSVNLCQACDTKVHRKREMKTHVRSKCSTFDFDKQLNQLTGADVSDEEWRRSFLEPITIERHAAAASLFKELTSLDNFPDAGLRCACCVRPLAKNKMSTVALSKLPNLSVLSATGRQTLQEPRHA